MKVHASKFWEKVSIGDDCWEWLGTKDRCGYGKLWIEGHSLAHRFFYTLFKGPIPKGLYVLHSCDRPSCVNPKHLVAGTQMENVHDMERKGRAYHPSGDNHGSRKHPESRPRGDNHFARKFPHLVTRGEALGTSKLSNKDIPVIRELFFQFGFTSRFIASLFGMDKSSIMAIVNRETWTHI